MQVCPNCGEENPPKFRLCGYCGTPLAPALPPQEVRKTVTIVFSDLKGSTSLGESLDSESLREVMNRYFAEMSAELERHGGTIEKFIGDAVMAVFGLPTLHEDDALRAVRAAAGMKQALARLNEELERVFGVTLVNRTGVNTGEVVAGDPTGGQRLVTGDAVNVAARLEQAAPATEVLLGDLTYQLVKDAVEVEPVEPLELKGKAERVPAYRLISVQDRGEGWSRRRDAPMVGRERELGTLLAAFDAAVAERTCRLVTVVADAGVGKSRLNEEFLDSVGGRARVLRGRCLSYGEGITFWPLAEVVRQAGAVREDDAPATAVAKLEALVDREEDRQAIVERVAAAIGLSVDVFPIEELFWGARRLLESLAEAQPLVVLLDDIHWAEPTFLDLIEHLLDAVRSAPLLLLCPARHDLLEQRPSWAEGERSARIVLEPLTPDDTERIVRNLLGEAGIAEDVTARIVAAAEGNPLFVEQMLSMLIDNGHLAFASGQWVAAGDLGDVVVPPSIQALLAARLDRLDGEERAVVEPAAVIGLVFPEAAVEALAPDPLRPAVPTHLESLSQKQFVRAEPSAVDEVRFRFNHVLIREAAYGGLLKRTRATLHERFVEWADRVNRERGRETEYEEILGYHLEQAHRYLSELGPLDDHGLELGRNAATRLASAARRASGRGDVPAAANLFRRASGLLPENEMARLEILRDYGDALLQLGEYQAADAVLDEAIERARAVGSASIEAGAALVRLLVRLRAGDDEEWGASVAQTTAAAIDVFEEIGDHAGLAKAWRLLAWSHGIACRFGSAATASERALEHAREAGDQREETRASTAYPQAALFGPTPVREAIERCEDIVLQVARDRRAVAVVLAPLGSLLAMDGRFDEARERIARSVTILRELGLGVEIARTELDAWRVEMLAGDFEAAERVLRGASATLEAAGDKYLLSTVTGLLGMTVWELERYDEADRLSTQTMELTTEDDVDTQALWRCLRGRVLARQGAFDDAERHVREAVAILEPTDALLFKLDAFLDLAEVQRLAGRDAAARDALESALELAELKKSSILIGAVRGLLDRLAEQSVAT